MSNKILDDICDLSAPLSICKERRYREWMKHIALHFKMNSHDDLSEGEKKIETHLTFLTCDRNMALPTHNYKKPSYGVK
ncbi:MAG: hypothetical protein SV062_07360 [Thermodesulfobacteriota bacterium]|nr:hypothetical protein [Thermodesulfobacteriota bacterium]